MDNTRLHQLYTFLAKRFDAIDDRFNAVDARFDLIDRRFDAIDARFDENEIIQNEILDAIGANLSEHHQKLRNHDQRITRLEKRTAP